ncbi:phosphodiesterase [Salinibacterium sp. G-O1]|uniref:phosphodiesterase n=1 Tax=Salinibacterium sp. G-O1 TaxID=3046208 RepID=UPI0024B89898|nr:phosphodiesterase [Salinibacterium sp. G-O1]MDJ0335678.1 phosphodiesterase [Salinibacterium sp. G-O1]
MIQLGQYPAASHVIAHISDTHLLSGGRPLYGQVNTIEHLGLAMAQLERSSAKPQAIVFTGDLADLGEPDAYERLREIVEPAAARMNAQVIWVMGNHDERFEYSRLLFDEESDAPQDRVYDIDGLRIISFDTTVPGYHHGEVTDDQLDWLADVLASPAKHGTILAIHHPPIPTPMLEAMGMLELHDQPRLAEVLKGTDVRAILAGHLHYSTHSTFAGIPVSVASATCYTLDLSAEDRLLSGVDFGQSVNVVHVYEEQLVHSIIPVGDTTEVSGFPASALPQLEAMTPEERLEAFSSKTSTFNMAEEESSGSA